MHLHLIINARLLKTTDYHYIFRQQKYSPLFLSLNFYHLLRKIFLLLIFPLFSNLAFGQQKDAADNLVKEGVRLQDAGQVDSAMSRYGQALELDKNNVLPGRNGV